MAERNSKRFSDALPGDLQIVGNPGGSVLLTDKSAAVRVTPSSVEVSVLSADSVTLGGRDLERRIESISLSPGVGESNVGEVHVAHQSVSADKAGGVITGGVGGTGARGLFSGGVVAVAQSGGGLEGVQALSVADHDGGLEVAGTVRIGGGGGGISDAGELMGGGEGNSTSLLDARKGRPPEVKDASNSGNKLHWNAYDPDGDLRVVAVRYASTPQTAEEVLSAPDDFFEANEGAVHQVFVGEGTFSDPYYLFFRDRRGTLPRPPFLVAGRSYRFERVTGATLHPFWVGAAASDDFAGFPVVATSGRSKESGILDPGDFLQFDVPGDFTGTVNYFCTVHAEMSRAFEVRAATAPLDGGPLVSLSGTFDATGFGGLTAYLAAEDSAGNASDDAVAVAVLP